MTQKEELKLLEELEEALAPEDRPGEFIHLIAESYLTGKEPDRKRIQQLIKKMNLHPDKRFVVRSLLEFYELENIEA